MKRSDLPQEAVEEIKEYWRERKRLEGLRAEGTEVPLQVLPGWVLKFRRLAEQLLIQGMSVSDKQIVRALGLVSQEYIDSTRQYWRDRKRRQKSFNTPREIVVRVPPYFVTGLLSLSKAVLVKQHDITAEEAIAAFREGRAHATGQEADSRAS